MKDATFAAWYAVYLTSLGMAYVFLVTFIALPKDNQQFASTALGFILGTLLAAPIGFFYGQSKKQAEPEPAPANPLVGATPTGTPTDPVATKEVT